MSIPAGFYTIDNIGQRTVLDGRAAAVITQPPRTGSPSQKWELRSAGGDFYFIINTYTRGYLAPRSYSVPPAVGEPLIATDARRPYQWALIPTSSNTFYISGTREALVVTANGPAQGVDIKAPTANSPQQLWTLTPQ